MWKRSGTTKCHKWQTNEVAHNHAATKWHNKVAQVANDVATKWHELAQYFATFWLRLSSGSSLMWHSTHNKNVPIADKGAQNFEIQLIMEISHK